MASDTEEAEQQNVFFDSVFTRGIGRDQTANITEGKCTNSGQKERTVENVRKYSNT